MLFWSRLQVVCGARKSWISMTNVAGDLRKSFDIFKRFFFNKKETPLELKDKSIFFSIKYLNSIKFNVL
jgi:hypothetical protein